MQLEKILAEIDRQKSECLSGEYEPAYAAGALDMANAIKDIIRKHMNDGWIPVDKNNIPKNEVLACDRYENELIGYLSYNADAEEFVCESDECIMYQVIAWMEKPEPYRPERREK